MGFAFTTTCNVCHGKGEISLNDSQTTLYEWCEGYFDMDPDIDWLERQLKTLIENLKTDLDKKRNKR